MGGIAGGLVAVLRGIGTVVVTLLVGRKRAGKAAAFETILGGLVLGTVAGYLIQAAGPVFFSEHVEHGAFGSTTHTGQWYPTPKGEVGFYGSLIGTATAACLYLLKKVLDALDETH